MTSRASTTDIEGCLIGGADRERVARGREMLLEDETYFEGAETVHAPGDGTRAQGARGRRVGGAARERCARGREMLLEDETYFEVAETFHALADGTRAKIV